MTMELHQLDPNYVIVFDYSKENAANLVSELKSNGLKTITRPGHDSKTAYAFTRVEGDFSESDEAFAEKQAPPINEKSSPGPSTGPGLASSVHNISGDAKKLWSKEAKSFLSKEKEVAGKGFDKEDVIKGGEEVLNGRKDQLAEAGKQAAMGNISGLKSTSKDVAKDIAGKVEKNEAKNEAKNVISSIGKAGASGSKNPEKDVAKDISGKVEKNGAKNEAKNVISSIGKAGTSGLKNPEKNVAKNFADEVEAAAAAEEAKTGLEKRAGIGRSKSDAPLKSDARDLTKSGVVTDTATEGSSKSSVSLNGSRAALYAIVTKFDFVQSIMPIYDMEKRKKLDAAVNNLIKSTSLIPSDHDLMKLEHLTRNPREMLYFFYFKNYILWLLPISLIGVACRLFSSAVNSWEFNVTFTSLLIVWSLLFTSSWIYYFEPLYVNKLGKVLGVIIPNGKKLSSPHVVLYKKLVFLPIALLFAVSLIFCQFFCFFIEIFVTQLYSGPFGSILSLVPTVLISGITPVLTLVYNKLFVDPLVKWENGPNPKKSKAEKNYILTFLVSYVPLFITLFVYLPLGYKFTRDLQATVGNYAEKYHIPVIASEFVIDVNRYKKQFFFYTVTAQIIAVAVDNVVPLILNIVVPTLKKDGNRSESDVVAKIESVIHSRYPRDFKLWKWVQSIQGSNYGEFDVNQNSSKLVVQFGYIAMFSIIWPLAPIIFAVFNLIIFRADLWRAFVKSKPSSDPSNLQAADVSANKARISSSPWSGILEKTSYLGSTVSVALLIMYRYSYLPGVGLPTKLEKRDSWFREAPLAYSWPNILLAAVLVEHLALLGHLYLKDILVSYRAKFEPSVLPTLKVLDGPIKDHEVDEIEAIMDEIAIEEPQSKNDESQQYENVTNTSDGAQAKTSGYKGNYNARSTERGRTPDKGASGEDASSSNAKHEAREKHSENGHDGDHIASEGTGGIGVNGVAGEDYARKHQGTNSVGRNRSTKRSSQYGIEKADSYKESGRHNSSTKETILSTGDNNKRPSVPRVITDSGSREIPLQSTSASKAPSTRNSKVFDTAAGVGDISHTSGGADGEGDSFSYQHLNRDSSFLDSPLSGDDAGATLPEPIPTSKNYHFRYDKNGNPLRFPSEISLNSTSDIAGSVGGLSAGVIDESGRVPKESGHVGKDLQKKQTDLKSGKFSNGINAKKGIQKDIKRNTGLSNLLSGNKASTDGKNADSDATRKVRGAIKDLSVDARKTLDPAVIGSDGNIHKGQSTAPKNIGGSARQTSSVADNVKADRPKAVKSLGLENPNKSSAIVPQGEKEKASARDGKSISGHDAGSTTQNIAVNDKENVDNGRYLAPEPESPAAQQFGRDVNSFKSAGTFGTAQSRFDKLVDVADHPESGAEKVNEAEKSKAANAQKVPQKTKSKKEVNSSKGSSPKTSIPSRSKTSAKKEAGSKNEDSEKKNPKEGSSNSESKGNQSHSASEGKSKHKNRFLHKIIKKLE